MWRKKAFYSGSHFNMEKVPLVLDWHLFLTLFNGEGLKTFAFYSRAHLPLWDKEKKASQASFFSAMQHIVEKSMVCLRMVWVFNKHKKESLENSIMRDKSPRWRTVIEHTLKSLQSTERFFWDPPLDCCKLLRKCQEEFWAPVKGNNEINSNLRRIFISKKGFPKYFFSCVWKYFHSYVREITEKCLSRGFLQLQYREKKISFLCKLVLNLFATSSF